MASNDPPRDSCPCVYSPHLGPICARCGRDYVHCQDHEFAFRDKLDARAERVVWMARINQPMRSADTPLKARKKTAG